MDVSKGYLGVGDGSRTIDKLELEIRFLEDWLRSARESGDEKLVRSLTRMIESRKRVLEVLKA